MINATFSTVKFQWIDKTHRSKKPSEEKFTFDLLLCLKLNFLVGSVNGVLYCTFTLI
jgi:hypothetical protein